MIMSWLRNIACRALTFGRHQIGFPIEHYMGKLTFRCFICHKTVTIPDPVMRPAQPQGVEHG